MTQKKDKRWKMNTYKLIPVTKNVKSDQAAQKQIDKFMDTVDTNYLVNFGYTKDQVLAENDIKFNSLEEMETKQVFGIKFEQKRNDAKLTMSLFDDMPTKVKDIPEIAKIDLLISLITLKYTQSNSVCYASGGQTIGVGAGQQSRIHCTRLAGNKADNLWLRHNEKVLNLPFIDGLRKCEADNAIDLYISDEYEDLLKDGVWQRYFTTCPEPFTAQEKKAWHEKMTNVALGSDAFFPFEDNIERAARSGVKYIAQPGGSVRDGAVIECCDGFGMAMAMTGIRLFHH